MLNALCVTRFEKLEFLLFDQSTVNVWLINDFATQLFCSVYF